MASRPDASAKNALSKKMRSKKGVTSKKSKKSKSPTPGLKNSKESVEPPAEKMSRESDKKNSAESDGEKKLSLEKAVGELNKPEKECNAIILEPKVNSAEKGSQESIDPESSPRRHKNQDSRRKARRPPSQEGSKTPSKGETGEDNDSMDDDMGTDKKGKKSKRALSDEKSTEMDEENTTPKKAKKKNSAEKKSAETIEEDKKEEKKVTRSQKSAKGKDGKGALPSHVKNTHFQVVSESFALGENRHLDVTLSVNFVVRLISPNSPAIYNLVVGDQIAEVNSVVPKSVDDLAHLLQSGPATVNLKVVRPWNLSPPTAKRAANVKFTENSSLFITKFIPLNYQRNGFTLKFSYNKSYILVTHIENSSRGAHNFLRRDRIHDVEGMKVSSFSDLVELRRFLTDSLAKEGCCTFLVERHLTLRSSPNPSACAGKTSQDTEMGDDASEIGAREATRHALIKDKYRFAECPASVPEDEQLATPPGNSSPSHEETTRKQKKGKKKKKQKAMSFDGKNETYRVPSEVKDGTQLAKVTAKSGLIAFVRNCMNI